MEQFFFNFTLFSSTILPPPFAAKSLAKFVGFFQILGELRFPYLCLVGFVGKQEIYTERRAYTEDHTTGKNGFNLAAVMLLGRDEIIRDVCPAYQTDALVRKVNIDRYDDRLTVVTNLVESFEQLFEFATLHLPDKFHVEGAERKSLRNIVAREMLVNTLMHREYSSSYQVKFVMEQDKMFVENANRARFNGTITLQNLEPFPKNPLIASFFRNIGYSEIPHYPTVE